MSPTPLDGVPWTGGDTDDLTTRLRAASAEDMLIYSAPSDGYHGGGTFPEISGSLVNFDKATTERMDFRLDRQPQTWRTFRLALSLFNPGDPADVVWSVEVNLGGATQSAVTFQSGMNAQWIGAPSYTFDNVFPLPNGGSTYGAWCVLQRIGGDAADTMDSDAMVGSLFVVRLT